MGPCSQRQNRNQGERRNCAGVILLITLVILVILSTLGYTLSARVAARRHRDQYMIDCAKARYACASGLKYALTAMSSLQFQLISRPNEPDFSDVFALSEPEYQKLLDQMALKLATDSNQVDGGRLTADSNSMGGSRTTDSNSPRVGTKSNKKKPARTRDTWDMNDVNDVNDIYDQDNQLLSRSDDLEIPGPYGPRWPLVTEPMEFEVGSAKVRIEIEDENAKYPVGWVVMADEKTKAEAGVGWKTFCEWMGYTGSEIGQLHEDLVRIGEIKPFKTEFKPDTQTQAQPPELPAPANQRGRITQPSTRAAPPRRTTTKKTVSPAEQMDQQNKEFAKLFHSSLINADLLARPSIKSDTRKESALKYLGLWATRQVNVNTAPRHVLEAAFTFGSIADAPKMAEAIIQRRQTKPIADVNEVKQVVQTNSAAIDKCGSFLTATSTVFTIRVTATSGVATATALAAVTKEADRIKRIAVISD